MPCFRCSRCFRRFLSVTALTWVLWLVVGCIAQPRLLAQPPVVLPTSASVRVPSDTARIGELVRVPVIRMPFRADSTFDAVRFVRFRFAYNPSVLAFRSELFNAPGRGRTVEFGTTSDGLQFLTVVAPVSRPYALIDTMTVLPFTVCLGDAMKTPMMVGADRIFSWLDANERPVAAANAVPNPTLLLSPSATLTVSDAQWFNLINTAPGELEMDIAPNPVVLGQTTITVRYDSTKFTTQPRNVTLWLYGEDGSQVFNFTPFLTQGNIRRLAELSMPLGINYRTILLPRRLYYCRFSVGNYSLTKLLRLE